MPYSLLIKMKRFSKSRIKQLWNECRIFSSWYSSIKSGKVLRDRKTGKVITPKDCIKRFAHARGLLWALGYPPRKQKGKVKTTPEFREMYRLAFPSVKYYYNKYKGKVSKI